MAATDLPGFGLQLKNIKYKDNWDWFLRINDYEVLWKAQPTYLISQIVMLVGGLFTLFHALRKGGRWPWLWLATLGHGIFVEMISYNFPDIDSFWHSQTPIMLLGGRLPLHILFLYTVVLYHASYAVSRLQLPGWAEPFAVGLVAVLIDIPYDLLGVKFLHWTWHDTDPNIADRHYWVPWNSYYFHATFAASFTFWFHFTYNFFSKTNEKWLSKGFFKEFRTFFMTSVLGMPGGVLMMVGLYHPLHDMFKIHSEVTFFMLFTIFMVFAWSGDRTTRERTSERPGVFDWLLVLHLIAHYAIYMAFTVWGFPEKEVSMGLHEPVGSCSQVVPIKTLLGIVLKRRKYLCADDYNEDYFTFSCVPEGRPANGAHWYTICGTPFKNRQEYIAILGTICFLAGAVFYNFYFRHNKPKTGKDAKKSKSKTH